ncbi:MAG: hypothetical protein AB1744_08505 [Candidatus Zixiibacteriota bacterium]
MFCPECNLELPDGATECYGCGCELTESDETDWVVIGGIEDKLYADFAKEALASYHIPAVVISKDGFFGNIGLTLRPFYSRQSAPFEISVPAEYREEAIEILNMVAGGKWREKET